jgi:hypothetical protein
LVRLTAFFGDFAGLGTVNPPKNGPKLRAKRADQARGCSLGRRRHWGVELADAMKAEQIDWQRDLDDPYLFHGSALGHKLSLRMNDFPHEVMFTLLSEGTVIDEFDDRPGRWHLPSRSP